MTVYVFQNISVKKLAPVTDFIIYGFSNLLTLPKLHLFLDYCLQFIGQN